MSTDAGTEEHRVSDTLLPMPRRIAQLPSLPNQDASTRLCCNAALAAHAGDGNRAAPAGDRLSQESTGEKLRQPLGAKSDRTGLWYEEPPQSATTCSSTSNRDTVRLDS